MARRPETRPTLIYWLIDTRPEVLVEHPKGLPFYCGKTVHGAAHRFRQHDYDSRRCDRPVSKRMRLCRGFVRIQTMEIVPVGDDWHSRERFWIYTIRLLHGAESNMSDGGEGAAGLVFSSEHRAKMRVAALTRRQSPETRAKISAIRKGRPTTTGHKHSQETIAKFRAAALGRKQSPETIAKRIATRARNHAHA